MNGRDAPGSRHGQHVTAERQISPGCPSPTRWPVCADAPLGLVIAQRRAGVRRGRRNCHLGSGRKMRRGAPRRTDRSIARRSPLTAFVAAFSLIIELFAAATPPALSAPAFAGADDAAIAAELKAVFGDAAQLCVQINDDKAPVKHAPSGHCCDQCPLCRFAAQAVAFVPPDLPALPKRLISDAHAIRAPPGRNIPPAYPAQPNSARAPPLAV
jgi:hypothetical protein